MMMEDRRRGRTWWSKESRKAWEPNLGDGKVCGLATNPNPQGCERHVEINHPDGQPACENDRRISEPSVGAILVLELQETASMEVRQRTPGSAHALYPTAALSCQLVCNRDTEREVFKVWEAGFRNDFVKLLQLEHHPIAERGRAW